MRVLRGFCKVVLFHFSQMTIWLVMIGESMNRISDRGDIKGFGIILGNAQLGYLVRKVGLKMGKSYCQPLKPSEQMSIVTITLLIQGVV